MGAPLGAQSCCRPEIVIDTSRDAGDQPVGIWTAADARGGLYVGWGFFHMPAHEVSTDDGLTWQPFLLPLSGQFRYGGGAADAEGNLVIVYMDDLQVVAVRSSDQARSFSSPVPLADLLLFGPPRVVMGPGGVTAAILTDMMEFAWVAVSPDRGMTWGPTHPIHGGIRLRETALTVSDRSVVVAYTLAGEDGLFSVASTDLGHSWSDPTLMNPSLAGLVPHQLGSTGDGTIQAVYSEHRWTESIMSMRLGLSRDGGFTWMVPDIELASYPLRGYMAASLLSEPNGHVSVAWAPEQAGVPSPIFFNRSPEHGLPGTWLPTANVLAEAAVQPHHLRLGGGRLGVIDILHGDFRDDEECGQDKSCASVYLARSCDQGLTWPPEELRLDDDIPSRGRYSAAPELVVSRSGRTHAFWLDIHGVCSDQYVLRHLALDPPRDAPRIALEGDPPTECWPSTYRLRVIPESVAWCGAPSFQWYMDGEPLPGADGWDYAVPPDAGPGVHAFHYEVACAAAAPCGSAATPYRLSLTPAPHPEPDVIDGRLMVSWRYPDLSLSWEDHSPEVTGYNLYHGSLRALHEDRAYDHAALACDLEREPPDATETAFDTRLPAVDTYYLVAPATCLAEGHVGSDSAGGPRPVAGIPPPCGPLLP